MQPDSTPIELRLPPLSDEAVVEIQDFLTEVLQRFESRYSAQIHRFYEDRSFHNLLHPTPRTGPPEDPPF